MTNEQLEEQVEKTAQLNRDALDEIARQRGVIAELKESLSELMDLQNGPPLATCTQDWNAAMARTKAALELS